MKKILAVYRKEFMDALRDRRTLLVASLSSLLGVPIMLLVFSTVFSQVESQEEKRLVVVQGITHAPALENFILRQGYQIQTAPADYEAQSRSKKLEQPVLLVEAGFQEKLLSGQKARLEIAYDSSNRQAEFAVRPLRRLLEAYSNEKLALDLAMRGISGEVFQAIEVREKQLQKPDERKATLTSVLPVMVLVAIVLGGMYAAIDTTAGERERGSLEPLMMNPVTGTQLVLGKWAAVASISMLIVVMTVLSFYPSRMLISNETLKAEFQFSLTDGAYFLMVLLPLAAAMSAIQLAIATDSKSFKEGQARSTIVTTFIPFTSFIPMLFPGKEPAWFAWAPLVAHNQLMNQVLRGEAISWFNMALSWLGCLVLAAVSLIYVAKRIRKLVSIA